MANGCGISGIKDFRMCLYMKIINLGEVIVTLLHHINLFIIFQHLHILKCFIPLISQKYANIYNSITITYLLQLHIAGRVMSVKEFGNLPKDCTFNYSQ